METGFNGAQLRLARVFNGFSLDDVAERVGRTRQYLHKLEINNGEPTAELREHLADALRVNVAFFYQPRAEVSEEQFHFRKLFTTRAMVKQMTLARAELFGRLVNYLDTLLSLPKVNIPTVEAKSQDDIERAAEHCRQHWSLGLGPIENMTRLAENVGAMVTSFQGISTEVDALSVALRRPVIVRNEAKQSACRQRFDVAHEVGHFVLHGGRPTGDRATETEANRFGSAFLVPRTMMAKLFPRSRGSRLDWVGLRDFKMTWKISKAAALYRAHQLDLISEDQFRTGMITLRRTGEATGEREDALIPREEADLLRRSLELLAERKQLYGNEIAAALKIHESTLADLIGFKPPARPGHGGPSLRLV
ncbi:XRE family transcriptional regulator [Piscinibacter gummiphilus]|uniref:XRE family transcriptional regulator n=1 Tax=Piscinibacter gummiphilus TaxID=946333 RepID=A0ABZ0CSJ9_9BURK|nr:XRE family transcriptional regulator [Piscinibacter gummiphilus]WOB05892.1 XRE family transcriptional regulator [Piscinibacter gummiphilus]